MIERNKLFEAIENIEERQKIKSFVQKNCRQKINLRWIVGYYPRYVEKKWNKFLYQNENRSRLQNS